MCPVSYDTTTEPLSRHPLFQTRDVGRARHIVSQKFRSHTLVPGSSYSDFETCHNHAAGLSLTLNYLRYGCDISIDPGELDTFYLIQLPLSSAALVKNGTKDVLATPRSATVLNPTHATKMVWYKGCRKLLLQINREALHQVAENLTDRHLNYPVVFDPEMNLGSSAIMRWASKFKAAVLAAQNGGAFADNMHFHQKLLEEELISGLLEAQSSSVSHILNECVAGPSTRTINRARSYILEHFEEPITVKDIAHAAECSLRSLQSGFQKQFGCTPMRYLRHQRLNHAHYLLQTLPQNTLISSVAFDVGFTHLGRFAIAYRNQFGNSPRNTLANRDAR